jgi:acetolactate synthase-1/2/3 large subunit
MPCTDEAVTCMLLCCSVTTADWNAALMDGTPMVVFCGQVVTSALGSDAFQEADIVGISRACTKWNVMVKNIAELPRRINEAFEIATSGRPGPVLVDLPKDVTAGILQRPIPCVEFLSD